MLIRKYIRFTFCCVLIVVLAFAINYLKKNMNNISESGNSGGNDVKKIKESKRGISKRCNKKLCRKTWLHFRGLSGKYTKVDLKEIKKQKILS